MKWNEVYDIHGTQTAVSAKDGKLVLLLCGEETNGDTFENGSIYYRLPNRPFYAKAVCMLSSAVQSGDAFNVYKKMHVMIGSLLVSLLPLNQFQLIVPLYLNLTASPHVNEIL